MMTKKRIRKVIAILLIAIMTMSLGVSAFATEIPSDESTFAMETETLTEEPQSISTYNTSFSVYSTHDGTAVDGVDDQRFYTTIYFDKKVKLAAGKSLDDLLKELTIVLHGSLNIVTKDQVSAEDIANNAARYAEASLSEDGMALTIVTHIGYAPFSGKMQISAPSGSVTALVNADDESAVGWNDISYIMPTGVELNTISQTAGTATTAASVTKQVVAPVDTTRGMVHLMVLKNGLPLGTVNGNDANVTAHFHDYLNLDAAGFAALCANSKDKEMGGYLSTIAKDNGLTVYSDGDKITLTANTPVEGDVYDILVIGYPRESRYLTNVSKDGLNTSINSAASYENSENMYSASAYSAFTEALAKAKAVAASSYYLQTEVDAAKTELDRAMSQLTSHGDEDTGTVTYRTHVQTYSWQDWKEDGNTAGTIGEAKRLEGIELKASDPNVTGGITYQVHVQTYGWQDWKNDGSLAGTEGEYKRLEAIRIKLTGDLADKYDVYYRVHSQTYGWLDWAKNGETAGTEGLAKRLEAIEVKLVLKGEEAPGNTEKPYVGLNSVNYETHVQTYGWMTTVSDGSVAGTEGEAKRLEGIRISLDNAAGLKGVTYRAHVQTYGWQNWVSDGNVAGTEGEAKRLEALEIKLTGEMEQKYDIYYRVHVQTYGWLGWAKNGESAGTEGLSKRLEAVQIVLVEKGAKAPGSTQGAFVK